MTSKMPVHNLLSLHGFLPINSDTFRQTTHFHPNDHASLCSDCRFGNSFSNEHVDVCSVCGFECVSEDIQSSCPNCYNNEAGLTLPRHIGFEREMLRQKNIGLRNGENILQRYDYTLFPSSDGSPTDRPLFPDLLKNFRPNYATKDKEDQPNPTNQPLFPELICPNFIPEVKEQGYPLTQNDVKQLYGVYLPTVEEIQHDYEKSEIANSELEKNSFQKQVYHPSDLEDSIPYPPSRPGKLPLMEVLQYSFNCIIEMLEEMGVPKIHSETMFQIIQMYQMKFGFTSSLDDTDINKPLFIKKILTSTLQDFLKHLKMSGNFDCNISRIYETVMSHLSDYVDNVFSINTGYCRPKIQILEFVGAASNESGGVPCQMTGTAQITGATQISFHNICATPQINSPPTSEVPLPLGFMQYCPASSNTQPKEEPQKEEIKDESDEEVSNIFISKQNVTPSSNIQNFHTRMITPSPYKMIGSVTKAPISIMTTTSSKAALPSKTVTSALNMTVSKSTTATVSKLTSPTVSKVITPSQNASSHSALDYDNNDLSERECDELSYASDIESSTYSQAVKKLSKNFSQLTVKHSGKRSHRSRERSRTHAASESSVTSSKAAAPAAAGGDRVLKGCVFCKKNGESPEIYRGHALRDPITKLISCPILRKYKCTMCGATGDFAHTFTYCPENKGQRIPSNIILKTGGHYSNGALRKPKPHNKH